MSRIRITTVVGARPQFIKAAVLSRLITEEYSELFEETLIHTGQHYDENMSDVFFREMKIPEPEINLHVSGTTHGAMTGVMLEKLEAELIKKRPDFLLVYGDTNSTLAGALAAAKLQIPVVHIEAGLRSYNMAMPEEQNRILTDHLSAYLFCPTKQTADNLARENIPSKSENSKVHIVGDIMLDASLYYRNMLSEQPRSRITSNPYYLLTLHRAENTDNQVKLRSIFSALNADNHIECVFPIHPRTRKALDSADIKLAPHIHPIAPAGFLEMQRLEAACEFIVTDSGGVQKEAYFFRKPCLTLREQTEWVETVSTGWNRLLGADEDKILTALRDIKIPKKSPPLYGDGTCGKQILNILSK